MNWRIIVYLASGILLLGIPPAFFVFPKMTSSLHAGVSVQELPSLERYYSRTEVTVYPDGTLGEVIMLNQGIPETAWDTLFQTHFTMDIFPEEESRCLSVVWDSIMYLQRWDTLQQPIFWRTVMNMKRDSCIVNVASTRQMLAMIRTDEWERLSDTMKYQFRDSIRQAHGLTDSTAIYVTAGKNHYYAFDKVLPTIGKAVEVFRQEHTDPWYAQAILLIESPGQLQYSPVGAYGSFQLMKDVALEHGLIVNDSIDEREDFEKAAKAAADLISTRCVPQTRYMLRKREIEFQESELWFRLLVLHSYHAGAGNVEGVLSQINPSEGGIDLMKSVWTTEYGGFKNASQNYSQVALASLMELDRLMAQMPDSVCQERIDAKPHVPVPRTTTMTAP
ncbi:transglycosylase SLT domain-containing protein [Pontibacter sp. G13]|uniref:transglycosylase SLT domain-containing protein n=1 Tax=Pontibacter sp. G13 TaxID=3074898 RepID=UPI002889593B|nr:transglycosylase SLT domain-containing protein [Pontibacter sp. G13]WNJ19602.1 transglycosylase SLT domain-containing protein [Pontibacter sp. G13]